jgi:hypothetical protein
MNKILINKNKHKKRTSKNIEKYREFSGTYV